MLVVDNKYLIINYCLLKQFIMSSGLKVNLYIYRHDREKNKNNACIYIKRDKKK